ncbi:MAG: caspase family protein [Rubrivivax sp.]|nr:caspase family protein [Rubrivivax sp.]
MTTPHPRRRALLAAAALAPLAVFNRHAAGATVPRVALVIGNAAYRAAPLANAGNDARAMAAVLAGLGFEVIEARDASKAQMAQALEAARRRLQGRQGIGLLYYAGHGLQLDWRNFLLPVDATPASAAEVPGLALDVQAVLDAWRGAGTRMNIVVLDACRDNPFAHTASARGLAPLDAPPGSFLAYATAPGNVAEDGTLASGHGLYTGFLLQELQNRRAPIEDIFKRVRLQVRRNSQGRQVPWESTSLEEDFLLGGTPAPAPLAPSAREAAFKIEKADWDRVRVTQSPAAFYDYLQRYPSGWFAENAMFRLDRLQAPQVLPQPGPQFVALAAPGANRWAVGDTLAWAVVDPATGAVLREVQERVTALDGDRVILNGGETVRDQMGALHQSPLGRADPAMMLAPADIALGKRWRSAFELQPPQGGRWQAWYEARVTALETLDLPAGRWPAFRVELSGEVQRPEGPLRLAETLWLDPATLHRVRHDTRWMDGSQPFQHLSLRLLRAPARAAAPATVAPIPVPAPAAPPPPSPPPAPVPAPAPHEVTY